jgi:hypothetical protein
MEGSVFHFLHRYEIIQPFWAEWNRSDNTDLYIFHRVTLLNSNVEAEIISCFVSILIVPLCSGLIVVYCTWNWYEHCRFMKMLIGVISIIAFPCHQILQVIYIFILSKFVYLQIMSCTLALSLVCQIWTYVTPQ